MLRCPVCVKKDMVVLELEGIEIDHCLSCGGIWLDAGELELMVGATERAAFLAAAFSEPLKSCHEANRKCPICGKRMTKTAVRTGQTDLTLDRCPAGHGVWFDNGELHTLLACVGCTDDNPVVSLVKDMFSAQISINKGE